MMPLFKLKAIDPAVLEGNRAAARKLGVNDGGALETAARKKKKNSLHAKRREMFFEEIKSGDLEKFVLQAFMCSSFQFGLWKLGTVNNFALNAR